MEDGVWDGGALAEAVVFLRYFEDLPDPRQRGKVIYPLDEVLLPCRLAVLAGAEAITDIARFGDRKLDLPRRFRPFADGTPAHDHLGDILASLDATQFQSCFAAWVGSLTGVARRCRGSSTARRRTRHRLASRRVEGDHGRIETSDHKRLPRRGLTASAPARLQDREQPGTQGTGPKPRPASSSRP